MSTLTVDDPFTEEAACTVTLADEASAERALHAATKSARAWRESRLEERIALCERAIAIMEAQAEQIAADITRMMGKPLSQAQGEVRGMALRARYMMSVARQGLADVVPAPIEGFERRIVKEPLGVVLDLPAWNYPLLTAVNVVVPALLAGNSVVLKHSPRSPLCGEHFADAFVAAGAPPHLLQALHCDHPMSERIVGDARVDHVVYTGSTLGGHRIQQAASKRFLHVGLELGGNDPAYIAPDCDLEKTAESVVDGAIYNAGQSCCAVERVYVHEAIYAQFIERCEALVRGYSIGDPRHADTSLGPIAQPQHVSELEALVEDATRHGARLITGGRRASVDGRGRFFEATLLADVPQRAKVMQAESFGPLLPIARVRSADEALDAMNDSRLGLTASVWTRDRALAARMASRLAFGTVYMNRCDAVDPALPWSGCKDSGRGFSLSVLGFDQLTRPKSIHFRLAL